MLAAPLSAATSASSVATRSGNDARAARAVAAPARRKVIVSASAKDTETIADRVALGRSKLAAALVALPLVIGAPGLANADDDFVAPAAEETAAPTEEAAAPTEEAAAPVDDETPYVAPAPQGSDDAMSAYEAATRSGGNSSTAKRVVEQSKPKKSGGGGGGILGGVGVLALGAAGFAAFKAGAGSSDEDGDDEGGYQEPTPEAAPAGNPFASFTEKKTAAVDEEEEEEYYEEEVEEKPKVDFAAAAAAAVAAAAAKREELAALAAERKELAEAARAEKAATVAATKIMRREPREDTPVPVQASTVRMPARLSAEEGSLLPRGFPTVDDLAECEDAEEKEELCDKADLLVERLEAKADSAEDFVDGPICAFFGFLKPNAIRNAEKARATAEEAAAAAAALRRAAAGGPGGGVIAGAIAAIVAAGAAAIILGGGGGDGEPVVKQSAPRAARTPTERVVKQPKDSSAREAAYEGALR